MATERRKVALLFSQAFLLGLMMAWILIPATAIFLGAYGSDLLPVTYIGAAAAGWAATKALAAALRREPLAGVATLTLAGLALVLLAAWLTLRTADADWVSFGLLVLVPIVVPIGFMFVVGQAGMLLDVRALKALYGRVIAGFALGFTVGGLAGPRLLSALGGTENLLAAAVLAAGAFLALVVTTRRSFPAALAQVEHEPDEGERPTLRVLLRNRYVVLIVAFQMLSAVESQWLDFLVMDRAAQRYEDTDALARFISRFTTIAYGSDILFLLLLAGLLLSRFGLRYGLTANALGVLTVVSGMLVAAGLWGSGATVVFVLIVAARVTDLVFSDGTSRTSLSAAYQAVPSRLRLAAQANVEGLAVPVAIGMSGVGLLVVRGLGLLDGMLLPALTAVVVTAWVVVAFRLYGEYRDNLLARLRHRTLDPAELTIDGAESLVVVDRFLASDDLRDIAIGLDVLAAAEHPTLPAKLRPLLTDARPGVRANALERLVDVDRSAALAAARDMTTDPAPEVRVAVAVTLLRVGDAAARESVARDVDRLSRSTRPAERIVAAAILAGPVPGAGVDRGALPNLLADPDGDVVEAALDAVRWPDDAGLVGTVEGQLGNRRTAHAAVSALARGGDAVLDRLDRDLGRDDVDRGVQRQLARVGRAIGAPATSVLRRHVEHPDRDVGLAVLRAVAAIAPPGSRLGNGDSAEPETAVVLDDLEHAARVLGTLVAFEAVPSADLLRAALRDELGLLRQRMLAELSVRYGADGLNRVASQFAQHDAHSHALALEWIDVTLAGDERGVIALLEPGRSDRERVAALGRWYPGDAIDQRALLLDLVEDPDRRWRRPWLRVCALYAATGLPDLLDDVVAAAESWANASTVPEAGIVHETITALRHRRPE
jgi:hypothetical protein